MTDREELSGYDQGGKDPVAERSALESTPSNATTSSPELKALVAIAVAAIVIAALYIAQDAFIPITLAVLLAFVLSPLVEALRRIGLWPAAAVGLSVLVALGAIGLVGTLLGNQAASLAADAPRYVEAIQKKVEGIQDFAALRMSTITQLIGGESRPNPAPAGPARGAAAAPARLDGGTPQNPIVVELAKPRSSALAVARAVIEPVLGPLETTVIVIIVAIFVLMQRDDLRDRFIRLVGSTDLHRTTTAMDDAGKRLSRYFVSQLGVNACFGLVIGAGLWAIGIPAPALWGVLAGLLRFVPYVGPLLAAVAPLALAAAVDPGWRTTAYVALLFVTIEPLTGYVVEPLLYGHSTGLSPMSVIVAAVFWTWMWGPVGLILSTPLTLCLVVLGRHVKSLEFLDVLLGDRPALSEADRFYQRALANDPDEALDQAEKMLADRTLIEYYESVALPALKLAANDEARGTITRQRATEITRSVLVIISELGALVDARETGPSNDVKTPPGAAAIACVAGRGPFDDAVAAMLAQLLAREGVSSVRIPHASVSREAVAHLDLSAAAVIAVTCLELAGAPADVRFLMRRLRQRAPEATIIVGLWSPGEMTSNDEQGQKALGADRYVASLRGALDASLAALADFRDKVQGSGGRQLPALASATSRIEPAAVSLLPE